VARLTTEMYLSDMVPAMKPADAFAKMAHREIERVPSTSSKAASPRAADALPPGIPLLIPGERFNKTIVRYLKFAREFNAPSRASRPTSTAWSRRGRQLLRGLRALIRQAR
jgi:arginine decarboxylase